MSIEQRFDLDDSTMIIRGMREHDACFTSERAGHFNVTLARAWAEEHLTTTPIVLDVIDTLAGLQKNADLDNDRLLEIAESDFGTVLDATVFLYVVMPNGEYLLIDGHHRLAFLAMCCGRANVGTLPARAYLLTPEQAAQFKVTYVQRYRDGREREISGEELLITISGIYTSPTGEVRVNDQKRRARP